MRLMTWNINSVRLRIEMVLQLLAEDGPDVLCLQETKTPDEHFPLQAFIDAGYPHVQFAGMKGYNGLAVISKRPLDAFAVHHHCGKEDFRHMSVTLGMDGMSKPVDLHNLYIPAGYDVPDPELNEKFKHKLDFVDEMTAWFIDNLSNDHPAIVVGDFNIAPLEQDVWSHKQMLKVVSHTPVEVEKLRNMQGSVNWHDAVRHFVPEDEKLYSWWSYRARDWAASDRGRRLDHIWVTEPLIGQLKSAEILKPVRGWERPSDHAPVVVDFR